MVNLYFKKDIHKSIEELLVGFYVYQFFLDTSTAGLILRYAVQDQVLSLRSKVTTRIAIYVIAFTSFLAFLRHLHPPTKYAIIIDFIGNVSTPSRSKLLWLDLLIILLQFTNALVLSNIKKSTARTSPSRSTRPSTLPNREGNSTPSTNTRDRQQTSTAGSRSSQHPSVPGTSSSSGAGGASTSTPTQSNRSTDQSSSVLFEYSATDQANDGGNRSNSSPDYYVDEEETRYSADNPRGNRSNRGNNGGENEARSGSSSSGEGESNDDGEEEEEEEEEDPLRDDDYEEILDQETFVLQLRFKDIVSYLMSEEDAFTLPQLANPNSISTRNASAQRNQVQNLPV